MVLNGANEALFKWSFNDYREIKRKEKKKENLWLINSVEWMNNLNM